MNFYHEKSRAKRNSFILILIFLVSISLFIFLINTIALGFYSFFSDESFEQTLDLYRADFAPEISIFVLCIVVSGMVYKYLELKSGGKAVANSLGAWLIDRDTNKYHEQLVLHVVDEMALASGISTPPVYILKDHSINGFVAGYSYDDAVIVVTRGAIEKLNKEELQGVIAHEFGHIFNGDMRLNLNLTSILHGIMIVGIIGWKLIHFPLSLGSGNRDFYMEKPNFKNEVGAGFAGSLMLLGISLMILGFVGTIIGDSIKSLISRQREYFADARAVQYTRMIDGIADALKKIGGDKRHSYIHNASVNSYSHFYFANGVESFMGSLIPTHPPLRKRILRLDESWDGEFITPFVTSKQPLSKKRESVEEKIQRVQKTVTLIASLEITNRFTQQNLANAQNFISSIPLKLVKMSKNAFSSQGIILALLARDDMEISRLEIKNLKATNEQLYYQFTQAFKEIRTLQRSSFLPLINLCIPSLKQMSKEQYRSFRDLVVSWIWANDKMVFFEWNLKQLLLYPLDINFGYINPTVRVYSSLSQVKEEASFFVNFLISLENIDKEIKRELFTKTCLHVNVQNLRFINIKNIDFAKLQRAFKKLVLLDDKSTITLLKMAIFIFSKHDKISPKNQEILYAIASALRLPLPFGLWG